MDTRKILTRSLLGVIVSASVALALSITSLAWFAKPENKADKTLDGEIGLRSYFYAGDGGNPNDQENPGKPFEIVSPIHFYNLTRLQNLGVFRDKKWFQIGHNFASDPDYEENDGLWKDPNDHSKGKYDFACINYTYDEYGNVRNTYYADYLDMSYFSRHNTIMPVGGEGAPFYGEFDGKGIPIKNLLVRGNPEDIGVFGYVSYEGSVEGLVCENLEIHSLGYTSTPRDDSTDLFGREIDEVFGQNLDPITSGMSLAFIDNNAAGTQGDPRTKELKVRNGLGITTIGNINSNSKVASDGQNQKTKIYNGYFLPTYPPMGTTNNNFTYSWKSSSSLLVPFSKKLQQEGLNITGIGSNKDRAILIDMTDLANSSEDVDENGFNCGKDMQTDARISLIASVQIGGFVYSRVIQSYRVEFYSNSTKYSDGGYSFSVYCEYIDQSDEKVNYHHGNNIGFLAGHVDGTIKDSYVYEAKYFFNDGEGCSPIATESETGLVGEIGTNVLNALDPEINKVLRGETGIINFTQIYNKIRRDIEPGDQTYAGYDGGNYIISYNDHRMLSENPETHEMEGTFDLFSKYLRRRTIASGGEYITKSDGAHDINSNLPSGTSTAWHAYTAPNNVPTSYNSIDFLWNSVIQNDYDEENSANDVDRGLGVFKIVTKYNSAAKSNPEAHVYDDMGSSYINRRAKKVSKVYFSTAEYAHASYHFDEDTQTGTWTDIGGQPSWGRATGEIDVLQPTTLPSYSDESSFNYPFSRDFDYCFELDLSQIENTGGNDYMYNTDSEFLANYLRSKLVDKFGASIDYLDPRFGFMFRSSENEQLNGLSSYMSIGVPGEKKNFAEDGEDPVYYPEKSICFSIENAAWANVSVVANGADVSIYKFDSSTSTNTKQKLYTMRSGNRNDSNADPITGYPIDLDRHRYFTFNAVTGTTGRTAEQREADYECQTDREAVVYPNSTNIIPVGATSSSPITVKYIDDTAIENNGSLTIYLYETADGKQYYSDDSTITENSMFYSYFETKRGNEANTIGLQKDFFNEKDDMVDNGALYAHIFKLPKGEYCIGASSGTANIYFLGVQGQTRGTIGTNNRAILGDKAITDVDFLLAEPTYNAYHRFNNELLSLANFSFNAEFKKVIYVPQYHEFYVTVHNGYIKLSFKDNPQFVKKLIAISRSQDNHKFYINGTLINDTQYPLPNRQ